MNDYEKEKRKNRQTRRVAWWWLVGAFALGMLLMLVIVMPRVQQYASVPSAAVPDGLELTATQIIREATGTAQGIILPPTDPLQITATHLVQQMMTSGNVPPVDPLMLTATAIVQQATQAASP